MSDTQSNITESVLALSAVERQSQTQIAGVLGLSQAAVAHRLRGATKWNVDDVGRLCDHFGVTYAQLTAGPRAWLAVVDKVGLTPPYVYGMVA